MNLPVIIQLLTLVVASSVLALLLTPALTNFLYRYKLGKQIRDAAETPIYSQLHAHKAGTPTMGGVLIWGTMLIMLGLSWIVAQFVPRGLFHELNFWSRAETYLPIAMMIIAAAVGLVDDIYNIKRKGAHGGGLRVRHRLLLFGLIAALGAWWFVMKLDWTTFSVPFVGNFDIGGWYVPIFIFVIVATGFSVDIADGLDGLAGGLLLAAYTAYAGIAILQGKFELAGLIAVIIGGLAAFLWYNIPPARFFMGDTGAMGLGVMLGVIAMLTNTAVLLPVIALPFVVEALSVIIQVLSKKFRHKKVFLSAPIHHHLEAKGWSEPKIVMRFWVVSALSALFGLILVLVDRL